MKLRLLIGIFGILLFTLNAQAQTAERQTSNPEVAKDTGINPAQDKIILGDRFLIDRSDDGKERQFPFVYKFGDNIFISYSEHADKVMASPVDAMIISRDNGMSWKEKLTNHDFYFTSMIEKKGILYGLVYFTYPDDSTRERMVYWTSANNGKTWVKNEGIVKAPKNKKFKTGGAWGSILFHRGMKLMKDGSVKGVMYGHFAGDELYSSVNVRSTDNCASWQILSTIATGMPEGESKKTEGYCEPTFAKTRDGSILCVMRIGSYSPLYQSRSYDNGISWTTPVELPGLTKTDAESVDPQLLLMKNGILALSYGRPGNKMAFSTDGCGYHWDYQVNTYEGQTTGYSGIVEAEPGKLLLISDQGRTGANEMAIWGSFINVNLAPR